MHYQYASIALFQRYIKTKRLQGDGLKPKQRHLV